MAHYRNLTGAEIAALETAGNSAADWRRVTVAEGFTPRMIYGCRFEGEVRLGLVEGMVVTPEGGEHPAMLQGAVIIDSTVGDRVFISNIGSCVARCDIGAGAWIEDVGVVQCVGPSAFGGGTMVAVINEAGGREVPLYEDLTAQIAYMTALYRHRPVLVEKLYSMIQRHTQGRSAERMEIGAGVVIRGVRELTNVRVGEGASIIGAALLCNGTVGAGAFVGAGVQARDFIFAPGAKVDSAATLRRCFVGEGAVVEEGFSAVDSLIFACSHLAAGEAAAIFAGPFTVSHHRSSLLIAGLFSFFNAGSGSNQSNHLFKTGPVHQGIHGRGCKFASGAYVMLPAREGAFTMVLGSHKSHHDTRDFPFSYLIEEKGHSFLMPGANLRSFGTVRDMAKWPQRDHRRGERRDSINYAPYNPYLGQAIKAAIGHSERMLETPAESYAFQRVRIKGTMLRRGLELYRRAWKATLFSIFASCDAGADPAGEGLWVDMAGMYAPKSVVEGLCDAVERGEVASVEDLHDRIVAIHASYRALARGWAVGELRAALGREPSQRDIEHCMEEGRAQLEALEAMAAEDGQRDEVDLMMTGYGIDAGDDCSAVTNDFIAVRKG